MPEPQIPHYTGIISRDPEQFMAELSELRMRKLRSQIAYCFEHSDFYRRKLRAAGVDSPQAVDSIDAFRQLPALITKSEHRAIQEESLQRNGHPYGLHLCADPRDVIHLAGTSGTTGQPTFYTFTRKDLDITLQVFGRMWKSIGLKRGDRVFHANGLSLWLGGVTAVMSFEAAGVAPVPVGAEAGVSRILRYMKLTQPNALMCTPSLAQHLSERAMGEIGIPVSALGIRKLLVGGEPGGGLHSTRQVLADAWQADIHDLTGGAWHNGTISDGRVEYHGMYSFGDDYCFRYDLRDPVTGKPLPLVDGAVGEAIHTALQYEAGPALRYATGDILKLHVGECPTNGRFGVRIEIIGRADDLLIVKGVKVYPSSLKGVIDSFQPEVSGHLQINLDKPPPTVSPPLRITIEAGEGMDMLAYESLGRRLAERMHQLLSVRPEITVVPYASLPRSDKKTQLIHIREQPTGLRRARHQAAHVDE